MLAISEFGRSDFAICHWNPCGLVA